MSAGGGIRQAATTLGLAAFGLVAMSSVAASTAPGRIEPRVEVSLAIYNLSWAQNNPELLFSADGRCVCLWWELSDVKPNWPAKFLVFDLSGRRLASWSDTNFLQALRAFPALAWRWTRKDFMQPPPNRLVGNPAFNGDLSVGARITAADLASKDPPSGPPYSAEMWRFSQPAQLLWSVELPPGEVPSVDEHEIIGVLHDWGREPLLVRLDGRRCAEVDAATGKLRRTFSFGPAQSIEGGAQRPGESGRSRRNPDAFSASCCAYESVHRWIACGCTRDRRVRVISVDAPEKIVFEANSSPKETGPWGGEWSSSAQFFADGEYLVAESEFERRFGPYRHEAQVYETTSWNVVWSTKDSRIQSLALSPDGKTMTAIRGATLIISPFTPAIRQGGR